MMGFFLFLLPILYNPWGYNIYAPPRIAFLYLFTLALVLARFYLFIQKGKIFYFWHPLIWPLSFFLVSIGISTILSVHPYSSVFGHFLRYEGFLAWLSYLAIFWLVVESFQEKKIIRRMLKALMIGTIIISSYAILQHYGWDFVKWREGLITARVFSTLGNPAYLGAYLVLILPFSLTFSFFKEQPWQERAIFISAFVFGFLALVFTMTRGAWLSFFFSLIFLLSLNFRKIWGNSFNRRVLVTFFLIFAVFLILLLVSPLRFYFSDYTERISAALRGKGSVGGRFLVWKQVIPLIKERPFFGSGPDTLYLTFSTKITPEYERRIVRDTAMDRAHNDFLHVAATMGLVTLAFYLSIFILFIYFAFKAFSLVKDQFWRKLLQASLTAVLAYELMLQTHFSTIEVAPFFWSFLALGIVAVGKTLPKFILPKELFPMKVSKAGKAAFLSLALGMLATASYFSFRPILADVNYRQALAAEKANYPEIALSYFESALKFDPYNDFYMEELGNAYIRFAPQLKNASLYQQGIKILKRAQRFSPLNEYHYLHLGHAYLESYDYFGQRELLLEGKKYLLKGKAIDENYAEMRFKLGVVYAYLKEDKKAIAEWKKVIELSPKAISAYYNLGQIYEKNRKQKKALWYYQKALAIDSKEPSIQAAIKNLQRNN